MFYRTAASIGQQKFTRFKEYWPKLVLEGGTIAFVDSRQLLANLEGIRKDGEDGLGAEVIMQEGRGEKQLQETK